VTRVGPSSRAWIGWLAILAGLVSLGLNRLYSLAHAPTYLFGTQADWWADRLVLPSAIVAAIAVVTSVIALVKARRWAVVLAAVALVISAYAGLRSTYFRLP